MKEKLFQLTLWLDPKDPLLRKLEEFLKKDPTREWRIEEKRENGKIKRAVFVDNIAGKKKNPKT